MKKITLLIVLFAYTAIAQNSTEQTSDSDKFAFSVNGGLSFRLAKLSNDIPPDLRNYAKDLKSGYNIGLDATYFIKPTWGLGVKYSYFGSKASMDNVYIEFNDGTSATGTISDQLSIHYIGPSYVAKLYLPNMKHSFSSTVSFGYSAYKDDGFAVDRKLILTGSAFGVALDAGYEYAISNRISIGFKIAYLGGTIGKFKLNDGYSTTTIKLENDQKENLSRLDINPSIVFKI